ncbi:hypothetical protein MLD38_011695 [Melastoma candidum]|uniref:Uncharacterized protein n=1 Tax=Melastoma candidum TaxID=119954 RepID=A0ACB9RC74_9MYRT|nr:hypothetical protein MLD38_011695 [Melastoma candidum]
MIAEKPSWVRHEGTQIFSIDVQPGGLRFATGGGDHKVRIWNMKSVGRDVEIDDPSQRLLATLRDHFGSVNCVRWAKHGRYVASGSDDQVILIHERKPGSGTTEFGSGEPPDVENWKVVMTLRGHTADVVDLNWSPDDLILASGSLDNTVHVWDMGTGICTAVLRGHSSLVKGVAWDPIGSFIASQSDDKTVIIWRTSDWSLAHRTDGHWAKSLGSTFFRRLGWSPCGHFITTTHGFQKPRHSAPVLERGEWSATFDFLGHNAPIIVVKFNNSMFSRNFPDHEVKAASAAWANGSKESKGKDSQPYNVIAIGSQDRTITVWTTASCRPLFVAKHFFSQSVVDLSWSSDGYSLFACSLDGTVATFHFDAKELGTRLTDVELDELKKNRYGEVRGRQANLAESPAQLLLEAASAKQTSTKKAVPEAPQKNSPLKPSLESGAKKKPDDVQVDDSKKPERATSPAADASNKPTSSNRVASPVKQKEYRRPDGRKRIIPETLGAPSQQQNIAGGSQVVASDFPVTSSARMDGNGVVPADNVGAVGRNLDSKNRAGTSAKVAVTDSLVIEKVPFTVGADGRMNIESAGFGKVSRSPAGASTLSIRVFNKEQGEESLPVCLESRPREWPANDIVGMGHALTMKETEIICTRGAQTIWSDRIAGNVTVLAGNENFWAVGCEDGSLQVYTKCGRRAIPTIMLGSASVFIDCDDCWKLLVVTRKGSLYVWDLLSRKCVLRDSLESLITCDPSLSDKVKATIKVISAKLSRSGSPLVVLATRHAYMFDMGLMCWMRVADDCFPASTFSSSWSLGSVQSGELASLQMDLRKYMARKPGWSRFTDDGVQTRGHLEAQVASALALKSAGEYRQCLLSYVRFLAREADESRLREVCENFLGPPPGMAGTNDLEVTTSAWDPLVLGMEKHKLLREDILPAMASNRKVQRLLNEFMDLLSEYENADITLEPRGSDTLTADPAASKKDRSATIAMNHVESLPQETDRVESIVPQPSNQQESAEAPAPEKNSDSVATEKDPLCPADDNSLIKEGGVTDNSENHQPAKEMIA